MIKGGASPDDPALAEYWAKRRTKVKPPLDGYTMRLLTRQNARCPLCGDHLLTAEQPPESPQAWERWWLQLARRAISADYLTGMPSSLHEPCAAGEQDAAGQVAVGQPAVPDEPAQPLRVGHRQVAAEHPPGAGSQFVQGHQCTEVGRRVVLARVDE
jgi:hypothetical protein